ncbi:MAG TPA: terminase gpA endonuclease subunit [Polyangiaceae bacterium]|nr:terminase gpA endonuclease subunit [Polyangiaceae bacterium]
MCSARVADPLETRAQREWLAQQFDALTTEVMVVSPSAWAERKRYLPPQVTSMPGYYRFEVAPYLREIADCMGIDSPIREVSVMKGVQLGLTVGVLENAIGYYIEYVKNAPCMLVTADNELAKLRVDSYITPMLHYSELEHLIKSSDENNARKTGKTDKRIEWVGGGFLIPIGAQNANKLRSVSIQVSLLDEIDAWPERVGKDGDPLRLAMDRTVAYEASRKILAISTPLIKGQSRIDARYLRGDQRRYFVCCLKCGHAQTLEWRRENAETGEVTGMVWETENGRLVHDSVRYLCEKCSHPHVNDDKTRLLSPENGAEWRPTAIPTNPDHRSYHISALYSPVGMQSWGACVERYLEAYDVENSRPRDIALYQVWYNNCLGKPYHVRGEQLRFEAVSVHRRHEYRFGEIPNLWTLGHCGGPVLLLTCAVDVHADSLAVAVFGWCRGRRAILVDYHRFEGDTSQLDDAGTWAQLRELIEEREYAADDGKRYRVQLTLIDSGYLADKVYEFAAEYQVGVHPVKGRDQPTKSARIREFSEFTTPMGTVAFHIFVDLYKDRWSAALRRGWEGEGVQPHGHFNAPSDITDQQLRELTVEVKREIIEKASGKRVGFEWFRPSGAANELWDLLVYNNAALDLIAWDVCRNQLGSETVSWQDFYDQAEQNKLFFTTT